VSGDVITLTEENFEKTIKENSLILVDFWASWCFPCKMIAPTVEELSEKYKGRVAFGKLNVDENQKIAMQFGVTSIPTLILFKNGEIADKILGAVPKEHLDSKIKEHI